MGAIWYSMIPMARLALEMSFTTAIAAPLQRRAEETEPIAACWAMRDVGLALSA